MAFLNVVSLKEAARRPVDALPVKPAVQLRALEDDSWQLVSAEPPRPKKAMLYVGNLSESCTEESL